MKILSTTIARKNIGKILNRKVNDITIVNTNSCSFDFLKDEPEIYSVSDLKEIYVLSFSQSR